MTEWMPIESAPGDTDILAWGPKIGALVVSRGEYLDRPFVWSTLDGPNYHSEVFTHWMPLPAPPSHNAETTAERKE